MAWSEEWPEWRMLRSDCTVHSVTQSMCVHKLNSIKDFAYTATPNETWIFIYFTAPPIIMRPSITQHHWFTTSFFFFIAESWNHQVAAAATCSEEVSQALHVQLEITWHPISSPHQATLKMETVSQTHLRLCAVHRFYPVFFSLNFST